MQILIVEDESLTAFNIKDSIEKMGFSALGPCDNADNAIGIVKKQHADLALVDVSLNGSIDGLMLTDLLVNYFDLQVIIMSGHEKSAIERKLKIAQPLAILSKPIDNEEMREVIERINSQNSKSLSPKTNGQKK